MLESNVDFGTSWSQWRGWESLDKTDGRRDSGSCLRQTRNKKTVVDQFNLRPPGQKVLLEAKRAASFVMPACCSMHCREATGLLVSITEPSLYLRIIHCTQFTFDYRLSRWFPNKSWYHRWSCLLLIWICCIELKLRKMSIRNLLACSLWL